MFVDHPMDVDGRGVRVVKGRVRKIIYIKRSHCGLRTVNVDLVKNVKIGRTQKG